MELIRPGPVPYWLDGRDTALTSRRAGGITEHLACLYPDKSAPLFSVTVSVALLASTAFTRTLVLHCVLVFLNITQNSTVISLFCGHSSWNKINFVSRGHFPASNPKAVQENKNKAKREGKTSGCVADLQFKIWKPFRAFYGEIHTPTN